MNDHLPSFSCHWHMGWKYCEAINPLLNHYNVYRHLSNQHYSWFILKPFGTRWNLITELSTSLSMLFVQFRFIMTAEIIAAFITLDTPKPCRLSTDLTQNHCLFDGIRKCLLKWYRTFIQGCSKHSSAVILSLQRDERRVLTPALREKNTAIDFHLSVISPLSFHQQLLNEIFGHVARLAKVMLVKVILHFHNVP